MYIPRVSANQQAENVAIGGERNDEDQAVPSVMELHEKLTDEEVDEMILETDVDDTQCSEQIVDVPVPQIVNMSRHTHTKWWRTSSKILSPPQQVANAQDAKIVSRQDPAVNQ